MSKIMPGLISKNKTPRILWYQNDSNIYIRILLCDIKDYHLRITVDHFFFSTSSNGNSYSSCFQLFGGVLPEKTSHTNLGREIKICLPKAHKFLDWLRLTYHNEKSNFIVADPDQVCKTTMLNVNGHCKKRESFAEYKKRYNIQNILPDVPTDDEDESDDERLGLPSHDYY